MVGVPAALGLAEDVHLLYLTGMVVPTAYRRKGVGNALLLKAGALAPKMTPPPVCVVGQCRLTPC